MKIITANRLGDGVAVYFTGTGWSEALADAVVAAAPEEASSLEDTARNDERTNLVVGPRAIAVELTDGSPRPIDRKERVRAVGPTVRKDLNRKN